MHLLDFTSSVIDWHSSHNAFVLVICLVSSPNDLILHSKVTQSKDNLFHWWLRAELTEIAGRLLSPVNTTNKSIHSCLLHQSLSYYEERKKSTTEPNTLHTIPCTVVQINSPTGLYWKIKTWILINGGTSSIHPPGSASEPEILMRNQPINTELKSVIRHMCRERQIKTVKTMPWSILICNITALFKWFFWFSIQHTTNPCQNVNTSGRHNTRCYKIMCFTS